MPELGSGAVGVGLCADEGGDGLAEGVRGDPFEARVGEGLAPLAADVLRGQPGATPGGEGRMGLPCEKSSEAFEVNARVSRGCRQR